MYFGDFDSKADVCKQFQINDFEGVVVCAVYEVPDYEGSAEVIYFNDGKFFMVSGSHCSCYGLEDQWEPVEMPLDGLRRILNGGGLISRYSSALSGVLEQVEVMNLEGASPDVISVALKMLLN